MFSKRQRSRGSTSRFSGIHGQTSFAPVVFLNNSEKYSGHSYNGGDTLEQPMSRPRNLEDHLGRLCMATVDGNCGMNGTGP